MVGVCRNTVFRVKVEVLLSLDGRGRLRERHIVHLWPTELGGNRVLGRGREVVPAWRPIRQPWANHTRLPVGRLRRR